MQAAEWDGGAAVYNLLTGRASWVAQLPTTLLAVDRKSAQLALGTHGSALVYMDAAGPLQQGLGLLHGLHVQAAQFYGEQGAPAQVRCSAWDPMRGFSLSLHGRPGQGCRLSCAASCPRLRVRRAHWWS